MAKDPTEFRNRFKLYKEGKMPYENGLPKYAEGTEGWLPDYTMDYILALENPTKLGLVNGIWRPPTDSSKWDINAIGGGLDIRYKNNPLVYNFLSDNNRLNNPYLTEQEEYDLRKRTFNDTMLPALIRMHDKYGELISSKGYARLAGMKWLGHPFLMAITPDSITGRAFLNAIESGDRDLDTVFDAYYRHPANAKKYAARIQSDENYWSNNHSINLDDVPIQSTLHPIVEKRDAVTVRKTIPKSKTRARWTGAENVSPYLTGKPILKLKKEIKFPTAAEMHKESLWKAPMLFKDGKLPEYADGKIHIKPANRGKFTALKKRTGHSASWFKENGTPAQKKMAVFALNAKKWHHANGKLPEYRGGKQPKGDGTRYLWDDQTQSWDRITDSDVANAMAEWAFTPTTTRAKFDYENTPNPVKPLQKNAVISQDNNAWTKQRVAEESNKRTWLSDAADVSHAIGEGAMLASNFVPFEGLLVEGANWLGALAKSYIKHPNYITAYHGSPYPFDVKNAWTATWNDLGLHVGPKKTATTMAERGGVVYKLRIPKEDTQTIDLGQNGVKLLSDNFFMPALSRLFPERYYDTTPGDDFRILLLREAGAEPYVKDAYKLYTENTVMLPLRSKVYPNIPEKYMRDLHELRRLALMNEDGITRMPIDRDLQVKLNQRANDILKDSGYKVIKYHNANPFEGGGDAYMITDPSIIDVIPNTPKLKPLLWPTAVDAAYTLNK